MLKLNIDDKLRSCIPAPSPETLELLEKSLLEDGCRDPLIIMQGDVIVDGHHRYAICRKHKIEFGVVLKSFNSVDDAVQFSRILHLGRRNLYEQNFTIVLGQLYNQRKRSHGGDRGDRGDRGDLPAGSTAETVAEETNVSSRTVVRAGKLADAYESLPSLIQENITTNPGTVSNATINKLANLDSTTKSKVARDIRVGNVSSIKEAIKSVTSPVPQETRPPESDKMTEWNKAVDLASRDIKKFVKERLPVGPWITDTKLKMILSQIDSGLGTLRSTKCTKECPKCKGKGCAKCNKTGMVPQQIYDVLAR